jgi:hypothetical protein
MEECILSPQSVPITTYMCLPNQRLTNKAKKVEQDKYRILPRRSVRVTTPCKRVDGESKGSKPKLLHYHNKFWKATPVGYYHIEATDIHFSEDPNESASKSARAARRRDKKGQTISKQAQRRLYLGIRGSWHARATRSHKPQCKTSQQR